MDPSRVFVKGLPPTITEAEIRKHFSAKNGEITDVKLIPQRRIGYIGFKTSKDASQAVKYFNKSYIRMSKLSVEPAKPIADTNLTRGRKGPHVAPASASHPVSEDTEKEVSKKRKRDELDQSDPKLQEFIRVMKSAKEEQVFADGTTVDTNTSTHASHGEFKVPEGESDDEYEQIPKKKEKLRRAESTETPRDIVTKDSTQGINHPLSTETVRSAESDVTVATAAPDNDDAARPTAQATDDDWLRSRKNRLLDLVDPEDLPPPPPPPRDASTQAETRVVEPGTGDDSSPPHSTGDLASKIVDEAIAPEMGESVGEEAVATITRTCRLFVRNLPYSATEEDLQKEFGKFGLLEEVHLPTNASGVSKGFGLVQFSESSTAVSAFQALDGTTFQGRIIHIIPAAAKKSQGPDEFGISKMPLKKQNIIRKRAEAASSAFNWNSLFMNQDAVNTSVAARLGVSKSEMLDPTSADAAVKQAIAETGVIQETKSYFAANGVDLNAFKSLKRGGSSILVKNFPYGTTMEELRKMFEESGPVLQVLMPPAGTIAIVRFAQANHAKAAFGKMAYRRVKDGVLFLEKAPTDLFKSDARMGETNQIGDKPTGVQKLTVDDLLSKGDTTQVPLETTSLFIRNLNFATTTSGLANAFGSMDGFVSARVKTKAHPKNPGQTLSMGFGFVEFKSYSQAQAALKTMDGFVLDGHALGVKASHKGLDVAEERKREDAAKKAAAQRTKIVIKNLPFQATKRDIRSLFGTYGQLRSVRVPKKADYTARGFAFADFISSREAENALNALKDTHLLGRRLVLDFAEAEAVDAEEQIEKMQRKVGGQINKMALQQLTGGGRKKVTIGDNEEELEA